MLPLRIIFRYLNFFCNTIWNSGILFLKCNRLRICVDNEWFFKTELRSPAMQAILQIEWCSLLNKSLKKQNQAITVGRYSHHKEKAEN